VAPKSKAHAPPKMWTSWLRSSSCLFNNNKKAVLRLGSITWLDSDKTWPHQSMTTKSRSSTPNRNPNWRKWRKWRNKKSPTSNNLIITIFREDRWRYLNVIHSSKDCHHRGQLIWLSHGTVAKEINLNIYSVTKTAYQASCLHQWRTMRWNPTQ